MIAVPVDPSAHRYFDFAAWASALALGWLLHRRGLSPPQPPIARTKSYVIALGVGAILGAYAIGMAPSLIAGRFVLSHSLVGALAGAIAAVEVLKLMKGERRSTGGAFVAPFALGIVIGRWGCLFSGLPDGTYGTQTALPWGVDLGDGIARHPVEIYKSLALAIFLGVYLAALARRREWALAHGFHAFAIVYGTQRFVWEFFKPYPTLAGPVNVFHVVSLGLVIYGIIFIRRARAYPAA